MIQLRIVEELDDTLDAQSVVEVLDDTLDAQSVKEVPGLDS